MPARAAAAAAATGLGVTQLDALLAPVPRGATLLLLNDPVVEPEPFLAHGAGTHLGAGRTVVYLATHRSPDAVRRGLREFGFDPAQLPGELRFADAHSVLVGGAGGERYAADPGDPEGLAGALAAAAEDAGGDAVLLAEGLDALADRAGMDRLLTAMPGLQAAMRRFRVAAWVMTRWPYGEALDEVAGAFDGLVSLRGVEDRVVFRHYFAVERLRWAPHADGKPRLYRAERPGGVVVYLPKILVTGPHHAGKSTFVHAVSDAAASAEGLGTTVALDHGQVTVDGLRADLFGTPGQARFDPLLRLLSAQALGVLVVVDSTQPSTFPRAREMLEATWREGLPAMLVANKQDEPGALLPGEVERRVGLPGQVAVRGCTAREPASAREVLHEMVGRILAGGDPR